jgi:hypothetical protein
MNKKRCHIQIENNFNVPITSVFQSISGASITKLKKEQSLFRVFEKKVLKRIFARKKEEIPHG